MGARPDDGFGLSEALVAAALGAVVISAALAFVVQQSGQALAHPDRADLQQRARAAADIFTRELGSAGSWDDRGGETRGFACCLPVLQPRRIGASGPDPAGTARADAVTLVRARAGAIGSRLSQPLVMTDLWLEPGQGCPPGDPMCGLDVDDHLVIFGSAGDHDFFRVAASGAPVPLVLRQGGPAAVHPAGALAIAVETRTLYFDGAARQLRMYDGHASDMPIIDNVSALDFEYWGTAGPPARAQIDSGVDTCWFDAAGAPRHARPARPPGTPDEVLPLASLGDGPWCGQGSNRFDADLLRIRRVRVTLRLGAGADEARGTGTAFAEAGRATSAARLVPDLEVTIDVSPRALSSD